MGKRLNNGTGKQLLLMLIILQMAWSTVWALKPETPVTQYLQVQWNADKGLPSNEVLFIDQTPDGYIWLVSSGNLVRFDGMKFTVNPISGVEEADAIHVDNRGILWIGKLGKLTAYDSKTGTCKTFTANDGLSRERIRRIRVDMNGDTWISFWTSSVCRISEGKITVYNYVHNTIYNKVEKTVLKKVNAIVERENGILLFGTREDGVYQYRDEKIIQYLVPGLGNKAIINMKEDSAGDLWIATDEGLIRENGEEIIVYTTSQGLSDDFVTDIVEDREHNLWVGTMGGLNRNRRKEDGTLIFEKIPGNFKVFGLFEDREENLWVGTYDAGLARLKDEKFKMVPPFGEQGKDVLFSVYEDRDGTVWAGTLSGILYRYDKDGIVKPIRYPELSGTGIAAIAEDTEGRLWLGTNGKGLYRLNRNKTRGQRRYETLKHFTVEDGLSDNTVTTIYNDNRGGIWFSTFDGVCRYEESTQRFEDVRIQDGLPGKVVHKVYEDLEKNIWAATEKGLACFAGGKIGKQTIDTYLEGLNVTAIRQDCSEQRKENDGNRIYWASTIGNGLKRLILRDGKNGIGVEIVSFTATEGMITDNIYYFFVDQRENFWLMSDKGILRVGKSDLNNNAGRRSDRKEGIERINCISYGVSDGLESIEFNNPFSANSAIKTRGGELLFITKRGIAAVNPVKIALDKTPPPVKIEEVVLDERKKVKADETGAFRYSGNGDSGVKIVFTALTFRSPKKVRFKYKLEGIDDGWRWHPPGQERVVRYRGLEPGSYVFRVTAANSDGIWNHAGASIKIIRVPYWYQTYVFLIAVMLLVLLFIVVAYIIIRKRKAEREEKEREERERREQDRLAREKWEKERLEMLKEKERKQEKYKGTNLNPHYVEECIKKLQFQMEEKKVYQETDLTLQALAEKISIPPYQLSQIINEKLKCNLPEYINSYRIREAKERLLSSDGGEKITTIAYDVGFNTMAAFYKAFKRFSNGQTPSRYRKENTWKE
jgi:ligand-binding sensor domain-containing protein/AraC-like DNA-binding protein